LENSSMTSTVRTNSIHTYLPIWEQHHQARTIPAGSTRFGVPGLLWLPHGITQALGCSGYLSPQRYALGSSYVRGRRTRARYMSMPCTDIVYDTGQRLIGGPIDLRHVLLWKMILTWLRKIAHVVLGCWSLRFWFAQP
jgi:hypothetical protein